MESDQEKIRRLLEGSVSELQNRIEVLKHHRSRVQRLNYETEKLRVAKITLEGDFTQLKDQIEKLCVTQNSLHETIVDQTILAEERVKVVLAQPVNSQSTSTVEQARKCLDEMNKLTTAINRSLVLVEPVVTGAVESENKVTALMKDNFDTLRKQQHQLHDICFDISVLERRLSPETKAQPQS
eukprot:c955_g1_i2.p1 GENE.c955_g1_i2~~c955_g1_i2.p1  ORF type:complete len:183 (-),score=24.94 c955_g1_i2:164-712(-)